MLSSFNCLKNFRKNISWTGKIVLISELVCEYTRSFRVNAIFLMNTETLP
jgi:hypothetical protein